MVGAVLNDLGTVWFGCCLQNQFCRTFSKACLGFVKLVRDVFKFSKSIFTKTKVQLGMKMMSALLFKINL